MYSFAVDHVRACLFRCLLSGAVVAARFCSIDQCTARRVHTHTHAYSQRQRERERTSVEIEAELTYLFCISALNICLQLAPTP